MSDSYTEFAPLKYDQQQIAHQGWGVASSGPNDNQMIVGFYPKSIVNVAKSKEKGRRICETKDFVKIQHPGETLNIVDRPATPQDKARWPRQWAQYSQGRDQIPDGIPISLLFPSQPHIADMLVGYGVHTIEQCANLSGNAINTIGMGGQDWVNKAKSYLMQAEKGVNVHKFEKTIEEKDRQIATLTRQVSELSAQVQKVLSLQPQPSMPGPDFDVQSAQIAAVKLTEIHDPQPQTFSNDLAPRPRKQRSDKGKARGPRFAAGA